jgi:hypothetical protein
MHEVLKNKTHKYYKKIIEMEILMRKATTYIVIVALVFVLFGCSKVEETVEVKYAIEAANILSNEVNKSIKLSNVEYVCHRFTNEDDSTGSGCDFFIGYYNSGDSIIRHANVSLVFERSWDEEILSYVELLVPDNEGWYAKYLNRVDFYENEDNAHSIETGELSDKQIRYIMKKTN